jgi:Ca2+-binding RTX toxin-like protein
MNAKSVPLAGLVGLKINGKAGDDVLSAAGSVTLRTTLNGGGGNDSVTGGGGDNVLVGGAGSDTLVGGGGVNLLIADSLMSFSGVASGNDSLLGGSGLNIADFSYRTDNLILANDDQPHDGDVIASNISVIWGGTGNDTIVGATPGEFLSGGDGADSIHGGGADDLIVGGKGTDSVLVAAEPVSLFLRDGLADVASGVSNQGEDVLQVDAGVDTLLA